MTILIITGACKNDGHWAYAYIDFCGSVDSEPSISASSNYCIGDDIEFDGSASANYTSWKYSVQSCNSSQTVFYGDEIESDLSVNATIPSSISINDLLNKTGYKCGYFRIVLYTKSNCSEWQSDVKLIYISCPAQGIAGSDKCCPGGSCNVQIGSTGSVGNTYLWTPSSCLSSSSIANPYFNPTYCVGIPTFPIKYTLSVTDMFGCTSEDEMIIYKNTPIVDSVTEYTVHDCARRLILYGSNYTSIDWNWTDADGTRHKDNDTIIFPGYTYPLTLGLNVINACGTSTTYYYMPNYLDVHDLRSLPIGATQVVFHSNGIFGVQDPDMPFGAPNAYGGATEIRLELIDGYGQIWIVYEHHGSTVNNGDIRWDCKLNGRPLPNGVYRWRLGLKNCTNIDLLSTNNYEYVHAYYTPCSEWGKLHLFPWPPHRDCTKGDTYDIKEESTLEIRK